MTTNVGVEPIGNEEFQTIEKREYGFDWEKSKGLHPDEFDPELMLPMDDGKPRE